MAESSKKVGRDVVQLVFFVDRKAIESPLCCIFEARHYYVRHLGCFSLELKEAFLGRSLDIVRCRRTETRKHASHVYSRYADSAGV